ncbi:MAG: hypothetical protein HKN47_03935 [Pirellulaceae bacterium]|nr:hypothetical protein [Pirellulaceae bacterium]
MPDPLLYWQAIAASAVCAAAVVATLATMTLTTTRLNSACVLGIGVGLLAGFYVLSLQLQWPPASSLDRLLLIIVPLALAIELIGGFGRTSRSVAWLMRVTLAVFVSPTLLYGSVYFGDHWSISQQIAVVSIGAVLLAIAGGLLCGLAQRRGGVVISIAICLSIQCAAVAIMMGGYIKGGAAALPFVAALLTTTIVAKWISHRWLQGENFAEIAIVGVGVVALFGFLFVGRFFGELSTPHAMILMHAPLLCWIIETPMMRSCRPSITVAACLLLVAIPLAIVVVLAKQEFDREMAPLLDSSTVGSPADTMVISQLDVSLNVISCR